MTTTFSIFPDSRNDLSGFTQTFERVLLETGFHISRRIDLADLVFVLNLPRRYSRAEQAIRCSTGKKILLRFEPKVVNPLLYMARTEHMYDIVLNIGGKNHLGCEPSPLKWPYFPHPNPAKPNLDDVYMPRIIRKRSTYDLESKNHPISMIVSNKVSWSTPSNYGLRRRLVLQKEQPDLHVFGMYWNDSRLQRLRRNLRIYLFLFSQGFLPTPLRLFENLGFDQIENISAVVDKFKVITQSEYHLAIENSSTYVSEKLIDAMVGGAIPIYYGPELSDYGIPTSCYLKFPNDPKDQLLFLQNLHTINKHSVYEGIREFLESPNGLQTWTPESVAKSIISRCV